MNRSSQMTLVQSGYAGNSRQDENWTKQLDGVAAKLHMQDLQTLWRPVGLIVSQKLHPYWEYQEYLGTIGTVTYIYIYMRYICIYCIYL